MDTYLMDSEEFTEFWLVHADANIVFSWLRKNKPEKKRAFLESERDEIETRLIERDEPLINLGLALYGNRKETGLTLINKNKKILQKAVLSGTTVRPHLLESWVTESGTLKKLVESYDKDLLSAFLSNELIEDDVIVNLYERKEPFHNLSDEQWYELLWYSSYNRRLSTPYSETWMDGFDEYSYGRVFDAAWKLFEKLPVNEKTARLLACLGEMLVPDAPHDMDVMETIARWNVETDSKVIDSFESCRYELANLIKYGDSL